MDEPDPDVDFGRLISEQRIARWQSAASASGLTLEDFLFDALDRAATAIERTSADAYSTPTGIGYGEATVVEVLREESFERHRVFKTARHSRDHTGTTPAAHLATYTTQATACLSGIG